MTKKKTTEILYSLSALKESCEALGYKKHIVAGAFFNVANNTQMTKSDFVAKIKKFLAKAV